MGHRQHRNGTPVHMLMPTSLSRPLEFSTHYKVLVGHKDRFSVDIQLISVILKVVSLQKGAPVPCRSVAAEVHVDVVIEP
jgi:hypothetical protein